MDTGISSVPDEEFRFTSCIRDFHVYESAWTPTPTQPSQLTVDRHFKSGNSALKYLRAELVPCKML